MNPAAPVTRTFIAIGYLFSTSLMVECQGEGVCEVSAL
jgi:hypothetical protein